MTDKMFPPNRCPKPANSPVWTVLALLALALPFFVSLTDSSVWDANEAFYVETPREMVDSGDWIVPSFNGIARLNKPPLPYWIVAFFYHFFGVSILWERLCMAVLALGSIATVFGIGRILLQPRAALLGTAIFATTFRFHVVSRRLLIDSLVLFCVLAAIACFLAWAHRSQRSFLLASALFFALGFLSKGPVALVPLLPLALYTILSGRMVDFLRAPWIKSSFIFIAVASPWFVALGLLEGWEPVKNFFFSENLGRFLAEDFGPRRGPFYYVGVFAGDFFPWSLLFPFALFWVLRQQFRNVESRATRNSSLFLTIWFATYFLLFSLSLNKQEYYILPLYPAAAFLVAAAFDQKFLPRLSLRFAGALLFVGALLIGFLANELFGLLLLTILPPLMLLLAAVFLFFGRLKPVALALSAFYFFAFLLYSGPFEQFKPVLPLAGTIQNRIEQARGDDIVRAGYFGFTSPSLRFYLNQDILEAYELSDVFQWLDTSSELCLITDSAGLKVLTSAEGLQVSVIQTSPKLYTTGRRMIQALRARFFGGQQASWSEAVFLVSIQRSSSSQ